MEELVRTIDGIPDKETREQVRELVRTVLDLHTAALERSLDVIYESNLSGAVLIDKLGEDQLVSNLLLLHGLHPLDLETRVRNALESVKPRLGLHDGGLRRYDSDRRFAPRRKGRHTLSY